MTCAGCAAKVEGVMKRVAGVINVTVNLEKGEAIIEMNEHVQIATLQQALKAYPQYGISENPAAQESMDNPDTENKTWFATYKPVLLILGYLIAVSFIAGVTSGFNAMLMMRVFMGGFFLIFSFFKMLDLKGFADSYAMYDIVAKQFKPWGYLYAFVELGLGLAFALGLQLILINWITLVVMSISIIGVLQSVLNKRKIKCACLGAVFNLPMSTVTIIEDGLMIGMSIVMLLNSR